MLSSLTQATLLSSSMERNMASLDIATNSSEAVVSAMSISRLFPALLECFGIILCGYVAGRVNLITSTEAKGLGSFVSMFALPALLFQNMVALDFTHINWIFVCSILVAKAAVFIIVCILTLLIAGPECRFGKAGLFPIFATQSNDFALGYPIVEALYRNTYPEYLQYIYLLAPISLLLLNPIGFIFCEIQKWKQDVNLQQSKLKTVAMVLFQVFKNPIVFMVIIGIFGNFIFEQKIPAMIGEFLDGLASSFSGSALFYLGLTMVGQITKLQKSSVLAIILLITAKLNARPWNRSAYLSDNISICGFIYCSSFCLSPPSVLNWNYPPVFPQTVEALYRNTYPEYLQYIYLLAPISLLLLNPIGFIFCEIQKWKQDVNLQQSKLKTVAMVLFQVFKNPIVFMVIIGIFGNFIFEQKIPAMIGEFLDGLASSFSGSALFYLGLTMVGQITKLQKSSVLAIILLITAKLLVLPLISREMVELLTNGNTEANYTSLSNFAFLYGVFPTAPSVAIYASQYSMEIEIVSPGMVINTFVSAPIMYVSAWLLTVSSMQAEVLQSAIQDASFDLSIVTLVFLVWTVTVMLLNKRFKKLPHLFSLNLLIAQCMVCIGMIVWYVIIKQKSHLGRILGFIVLYSSLYSAYIWTGLIALSLLLLEKNASEHRGIFIIAGWGIPAFIVGILLIAGHPDMQSMGDSAFIYGNDQVISTTLVLSCSIILAGSSLMLLSRYRQNDTYQMLQHNSISRSTSEEGRINEFQVTSHNGTSNAGFATGEETSASQMENQDELSCYANQEIPNDDSTTHVTFLDAEQSMTQHKPENRLLIQKGKCLQSTDPQLARHVLLCLLLVIGLFANVSSCLWLLVNPDPGRLYVELQFFCIIFNFGQGFISFGIFGLDKHLVILPFKKRLENLWFGKDCGSQNDNTEAENIRMTCHQFTQYHKDRCVKDIVKKRRRCAREASSDIFQGCDLMDWLIQVGLAHDQREAIKYTKRLLEGGIIRHLIVESPLQDESLYYCMVQRNGT